MIYLPNKYCVADFSSDVNLQGSLYDILKKKGRLDPLTAVAYALDIAR